jgi:hypothetical protein
MPDHETSIDERLKQYPVLKNRIESLLNIVEDSSGNTEKADDAEHRAIRELRRLGSDLLHEWASEKESAAAGKLRKNDKQATGHGKKSSFGTRRSVR